ncbi:MAG: sulfite exporter TauE/SafE family protein [Deltaproteobacteria bacterium]|nr:sulfite exporter TauE/SafE family protein [Deltaproteobacteria bacterium]
MDIAHLASELIYRIDYHTYWGVFLFGLLISATAMSTGIDGAIFWEQVLLFVYGLEPSVAIAYAIGIEVFGFGSGLYGYAKYRKIQYHVAIFLLIFALPLGIIGAAMSKVLPADVLIFLMGVGCVVLAINNVYRARTKTQERLPGELEIVNKPLGAFLGAVGGFFSGAIGVGIGEIDHYYLMMKNKYPVPYTSGTAVFMVAVTAIACTLFNIFHFKSSGQFNFNQVLSIMVFAAPAVVIGARVGVYLAHIIKRKQFNYYIAIVFTIMAFFSFYKVFHLVHN